MNNALILAVTVFILLQWLKRPNRIFYYSRRFPTFSPWQAVVGAFTHQDRLDLQEGPFSWRNMRKHFFQFLQPISYFGLYLRNENWPSGTFRLRMPHINLQNKVQKICHTYFLTSHTKHQCCIRIHSSLLYKLFFHIISIYLVFY